MFFIYLTYTSTSEEDRTLILQYIYKADPVIILCSVLFGVLSHLSRAYRWKFLLAPLGYKPRLINSILAVLIAYISNLGIPRSGELFRATSISTYEDIPFEKAFGTIVAERLVDLLILLGFVATALILQFDLFWGILQEKNISFSQISVGIGTLILLYFLIKKGLA